MIYETLKAALAAEAPVAVATIVGGDAPIGAKLLIRADGTTVGALPGDTPQAQIIADAQAMLLRGENGIRSYRDDLQVFIETYPPPPTLLIVGAVHIAIPLVTFGKTLGFRVIVIDARGAFATEERFAHADELIHAWPDEVLPGRLTSNSHVVLLTHDPKLDDPALKVALPSPARYVGALGSPRTHAKRLERLRAEGIPEAHLARLHAPIGLKIGGASPEEIAVSIIAEIVAARHGLTGK
ncbi:MAG TPA: XdhC/CoxI family protein [Roseiflexaceae bacterium]|nr:XdhC/CoxI family protein [Roseiflexaceae bacterium]HMP42272.1 XdhC/CoxI family protein [Roseiflexaceae bacterium]